MAPTRSLSPSTFEPLVEFVEETTPDRIVNATHDKLAAGTTVKRCSSPQRWRWCARRICRPAITAARSTRSAGCTPCTTSRPALR